MENKCKRFLSLLLAFVMVLGMFPAGYAHVHAAEAGLTPVAPEAGKTYVICFKADNGDYYAMTSTYANKNNHGTLLTEKVTGTYNEAIGWNLVAADDNGGYYLNAADDGHGLSLNGTIDNDAFADANHLRNTWP